MKHAGVLFDSLILLDTVRVVLGGGAKASTKQRYTNGADLDFEASTGEQDESEEIKCSFPHTPGIQNLAAA